MTEENILSNIKTSKDCEGPKSILETWAPAKFDQDLSFDVWTP